MAVIMVEVREAASRLDEMVDAALAGEQVVVTRGDEPVGMLVSFDAPGRVERGEDGSPGGSGSDGDTAARSRAPAGAGREVIVVRRRVRIVASML